VLLLLIPAVLALLATREDGALYRPQRGAAVDTPLRGLIALLAMVVRLQVGAEGVVRTFFTVHLDARLHVRRHHNGVEPGVGGRYVIRPKLRLSAVRRALSHAHLTQIARC
jgi:hypothetical protein